MHAQVPVRETWYKAQVAARQGEFPAPGRVARCVPSELWPDCYGVGPSWIKDLSGTGVEKFNWDMARY